MASSNSREIVYALKMRNDSASAIAAFRTEMQAIGTTVSALNTKFAETTQRIGSVKSASDGLSASIKQNTADLNAMQKAAENAASSAAKAVSNAAKAGSSKSGSGGSGSSSGAGSFLPSMSGLSEGAGEALGTVGKLALASVGLSAGLLGAAEGAKALWETMEHVVEAGDQMTIGVSKLTSIMGTTRGVGQDTFNALEQAAEKSGLATGDLVDTFTRFDLAMKGVGATRQQVLQFTDTLTTLAHVSGTTGAQASRAFLQLSQGMSVGVVHYQDWKLMTEDMPALANAIGNALGKTSGEMMQMSTTGKLTTDVVMKAVLGMGANVTKTFNDMPVSLESARSRLKTASDQLFANIDARLDLSQTLAKNIQYLADWSQQSANAINVGPAAALDRAKQKLAELQAQAKATPAGLSLGGAGGTNGLTPEVDQANQQARVAAQQAIVDGLQKEADAQAAADKVKADGMAVESARTKEMQDAKTAMDALGLTHESLSTSIQALTQDIAKGQDVTLEYNGVMLRASQVLDLLKQKADPAAQAVAALNNEMRQAAAANLGGYQAKLQSELSKADKVDGSGTHLTDAQRASITSAVNNLEGVQAQDEVRKAQNQNLLAQAKLRGKQANGGKGDGGLSERNEQARQHQEELVRQYGPAGAASIAQVGTLDQSTASLNAQASLTKAPKSGAAGAKELSNALTEAQGRAKEAQDAYTAFMAAGGQASAQAALQVKAHTEALKLTNGTTKDTAQVEAQLLAAYQAEAKAKGDLEVAKDIDDKQQEIADLKQEISLRNLSTGARERELAVQQVAKDLQRKGVQADPAKVAQLQSLTGQQFDLKAANDFQGSIDKTVQGYKDQAATIGLSGDALEREQVLAKAAAEAFEKGTPFTAQQKQDLIEAQQHYQDLVHAMQANPMAGLRAGLQDALDSARDTFTQMRSLVTTAMDGISTDIADMVVTGKASWSDLTKTILEDMIKIAVQRALIAPLTNGLLNVLTPGAATADTSGLLSGLAHTGALAGVNDNNNPSRNVSASMFSGAPRYHTGGLAGLTSGEVPIIAKRGEAILPTVRLPDGSMGVQSTGGGGGQAVFAPTVAISVDARGNSGSAGDPGGGKAISAQLDKTLAVAMDAHMTDFINRQRRPGGMLARG